AEYIYDISGRLIQYKDKLGRTITYIYDRHSRIVSVGDSDGYMISYSYDFAGRQASIIDSDGKFVKYGYNTQNQLTSLNDNGNITTFEYDRKGNVIAVNGIYNTLIEYDNNGNMISIDDENKTSIIYDNFGRLLTFSNNEAVVKYVYNNTWLKQIDVSSLGKQILYNYDVYGFLINTSVDGIVSKYDYYFDNKLKTIDNNTFEYDKLDRVVRMNVSSVYYVIYKYDKASQLLSIVYYKFSGEILQNYTYEYDVMGNVAKKIENSKTWIYDYDKRGQLTYVKYSNNTIVQYEYDAVGNRIKKIVDSVVTGYKYDYNDKLVSAGTKRYEYDDSDRLTRIIDASNITIFSYDEDGWLSEISTNGNIIKYEYYSDGRRKSKTVNGVKISYLYSDDEIIAELDINGNIVKSYDNYGIDKKIGFSTASKKYYYITDSLGSVVKVIDSNGNVVNSYEYDEFGNVLQKNEQIGNDFLYTGREYDGSGVYYYRNRYYLPELGRFITPDPIVSFDNDYSYVRNSPVNYVDPYGLRYGEPDIQSTPTIPSNGNPFNWNEAVDISLGTYAPTNPYAYGSSYREFWDTSARDWANGGTDYIVNIPVVGPFDTGVMLKGTLIDTTRIMGTAVFSGERFSTALGRVVAKDPCIEWHEVPISGFWFAVDLLGLGAGKGVGGGTGRPIPFAPSKKLVEQMFSDAKVLYQKGDFVIEYNIKGVGKVFRKDVSGVGSGLVTNPGISGKPLHIGIRYGDRVFKIGYNSKFPGATGLHVGEDIGYMVGSDGKLSKSLLKMQGNPKSRPEFIRLSPGDASMVFRPENMGKFNFNREGTLVNQKFISAHYNIMPMISLVHGFSTIKPNCPPKDPCKKKLIVSQ
ncbi:MAG: RHS repeat-associated core domain-containing protein, partial [Candidatus Aenigmatarchaeota archaeon]